MQRGRGSSEWSSLPSHERERGSSTIRPMIAAEASPSFGNSFEMTCRRHGSLPVHCSRYLMLPVSVSSPEMFSSRSTTIAAIPADKARVRDDRERFTNQRCEPKITAETVERRTTDISPANHFGEHAGDDALTTARRTDREKDFVKVKPTAHNIATPLAQNGDAVGLRAATARRGSASHHRGAGALGRRRTARS